MLISGFGPPQGPTYLTGDIFYWFVWVWDVASCIVGMLPGVATLLDNKTDFGGAPDFARSRLNALLVEL
jgi:hypothetical protein